MLSINAGHDNGLISGAACTPL